MRNEDVKHTPGPWEITGMSLENGNVTVGQRDLRIVIADVTNAASFGDMLAGAMKRGGGSFDQGDARTQMANARLIAAAPELLPALKAAMALVSEEKGWGTYRRMEGSEIYQEAEEFKTLALAAIAKAEG